VFICGAALGETAVHSAMTGVVSSDAEGPMVGVVVSAKLIGGKVTVSVISDKEERYAFPANRLAAGHIRSGSEPPANRRQIPT
jgi:hypothetical protein